MIRSRFLCACALFVGCVLSTRAEATFDTVVPRKPRETFDYAAFRLWLPDNVGTLKGVAVVTDGINVDGRDMAGKPWQDFAREHSFALVTAYFRSDDLSRRVIYCQAEYGSGRALLAGLAALGQASGHPEMETVPLFLEGFSAGGQFSYSFACYQPDRVAAFCSNKGGVYLTPATAAARDIPGLFIAGEKDLPTRRSETKYIYTENRRLGARWCMAVEPVYGHNHGQPTKLVFPFFEAVMRQRERPASERTGIVLDLDHRQLIPPGVPPKSAGFTLWFPDDPTLAAWQAFMTKPK